MPRGRSCQAKSAGVTPPARDHLAQGTRAFHDLDAPQWQLRLRRAWRWTDCGEVRDVLAPHNEMPMTFLRTAVVSLGLLIMPVVADGQPAARIPRIGILSPAPATAAAEAPYDAFREALRGLGYVEGRTSPSSSVSRMASTTGCRHWRPIWPALGFDETGALASYGPSVSDNFRRSAIYLDKILKGVRPGDLPVEQPAKFYLVINLRTARTLGLTILSLGVAASDQGHRVMTDTTMVHTSRRPTRCNQPTRWGAGLMRSVRLPDPEGEVGRRHPCQLHHHWEVDTPAVASLGEEVRERRRLAVPLQTTGTGWDVGWAAVYLASDESRWVTGLDLPIDGQMRILERPR